MNRIQRLVQDREKTNRIIIILAIITVACLIVNYMFYEELGIFFFMAIASILLIGFFIYQINEYKKPTEDMIKFEEEHENFSKLYVDLTGRTNFDDLMVESIDGRKPIVGKDNYGIFIYIVDKDEDLFREEAEESEIEYVEEVSEEKMDEMEQDAEDIDEEIEEDFQAEINFTDMTEFLKEEDTLENTDNNQSEKYEEREEQNDKETLTEEKEEEKNEEEKKNISSKKPRDKYTRIRIDKRKLEKKVKRTFHTDKDTINLIYEFSKPNSRYALRYFDDVDKFTINNFY